MEKKVSKRIVLIAGGSGLIGQEVQKELKKSGHEVRILTRQENPEAPYFHWDPKNKEIDRAAIKGVQVIINLVGVGIADKRWSDKRKEAIFNSRIKPTQFLHEISQNTPDRKSTRLNSSHVRISYAVFCLKKKKTHSEHPHIFCEHESAECPIHPQLLPRYAPPGPSRPTRAPRRRRVLASPRQLPQPDQHA